MDAQASSGLDERYDHLLPCIVCTLDPCNLHICFCILCFGKSLFSLNHLYAALHSSFKDTTEQRGCFGCAECCWNFCRELSRDQMHLLLKADIKCLCLVAPLCIAQCNISMFGCFKFALIRSVLLISGDLMQCLCSTCV